MVGRNQNGDDTSSEEHCCLQEELSLVLCSKRELKTATVKMGNGSSQSIVLGPPKPLGFPVRGDMRYPRGTPKYAQPHNRVLPKPVAGQRLRCTDNGNILHNVGTIRGLKHSGGGIRDENEDVDPEMMEILRKRSELTEKEQTCYHQFNLRNHRLFHSDPDIARSRPTSYSQEGITPGGQRRSGGGVAMRASKLRYKKKSRAPEPPNGNSLPRQFERMSQPTNSETRSASQERKGLCRCVNSTPDWKPKNRAPPPPHNSAADTPPPPPPLPSKPTSHATSGLFQDNNSVTRTTHGGPSVTRITDAAQSRIQGYEKNIHPLSKWRNNRSAGDLRLEDEGCTTESRTTVFDSKSHLNGSDIKKPPLLNTVPDAFQKEIVAVTKKIAENLQHSEHKNSSKTSPQKSSCQEHSSPKQYYFCDAGAFKSSSSNKASSYNAEGSTWSTPEPSSPSRKICTADVTVHSPADVSLTRQKKKSLENKMTSPPDSKEKFPVSPSDISPTASLNRKRRAEWEALHESLIQKNEDESDIDLRLRPVLPRKMISIPQFSPAEAWQALGSDGGGPGSSNQSTSEGDEVLEPIRRCNLPTAPRRSPAAIYGEKHPTNRKFKTTTCDTYQWTPRQDLADDSDASSVNSEDAVVPRNRDSNSNDIPMRFSLPTVMFSNMRPIGTEIPSNKIKGNNRNAFSEDSETVPLKSGCKKKYQTSSPDVRMESNTSTNFKKFLGIRNKFLSEEDISASDSNWTFGQYALLKKGKQYSSDLMLAKDKKRYEMTATHNSGELLGDILLSKANDVQKRLRYAEPSNSSFSFYSTEGHVMYLPSGDEHSLNRHDNEEVPSPPTKGRVYHTRRVVESKESHHHQMKSHPKGKKKLDLAEREMDRKRNLELVRMLEEEVRKRRNKEKITIRQQLQMMKRLSNVDDDDDEDEFDDEAYFTEPKSRDGDYSPQGIDVAAQKRFLSQERRTHQNDGPLSQWKSSPALLEESVQRGPRRTVRDSSSSITSSPDLMDSKYKHRTVAVDSWTARQQKPGLGRKKCDNSNDVERSSSDDLGIVSDRPSPSSGVEEGRIKSVPHSERRERKTTSIYKQLMDIVRREERQMNKACGEDGERISRDSSSSSQHASSLSATSSASSSSSYSYSDSVDHKIVRSSSTSKSGIPANDEFHHTSLGVESPANRGRCPRNDLSAKSPFQVALVQPFNPSSKGYRPVPFDVVVSGSAGCKNSGFQEGRQVSSQVS